MANRPRKRYAAAKGPAAPPPADSVKPAPRIVGKVRRSHVASIFGAGALVDLRAPGSGAPLSGLVAGLEEWDRAAPPAFHGLLHMQRTSEPRLQKRLNVSGFRLPPVKEEGDKTWTDVLPVVRFPRWLQCPKCERLDRADRFYFDQGRPERSCACSDDGKKSYAVPVRLVVACENGHLDDFPWQRWIGCICEKPRLKFKTTGAGLAGKVVSCLATGCGSRARSLEGVFARGALKPLGLGYCTGRRPWLALPAETCTQEPRVLQRGASTVYYPQIESALDIPPFSMDQMSTFGPYWADLMETPEEKWSEFISLNKLPAKFGKPADVLLRILCEWKRALDSDGPDAPLEWAEYLQLLESEKAPVDLGQFQTRPEPVPPELGAYFGSVVLVRRLREVRAHVGFTRVKPPSTAFRAETGRMGRLYSQALPWLPAIELRGEGIFVRFDDQTLESWERSGPVLDRVRKLTDRRSARALDSSEEPRHTSPRFLLIHSFAHALMRQLSLSCGYSSAALRERLYVDQGSRDMAGLLIHTGSTDADGTLGGLVRQGREERLESTIREMLIAASWCSSDPLCMTGAVTLSSPDNLAACHACLLAPETSCQLFNLLLDRALLVGTTENPEVGYFHEFLAEVL